MHELSPEEQQIVDILCVRFNPQAIVLVGSRADGTATSGSDWDVFLFCGTRPNGTEIEEKGLKIDVNFSTWPKEGGYFDTGFGPTKDIKVLFDDSQGKLSTLLKYTEEAYKQSPRQLQSELSNLRLRAFDRYIEKLRKYEKDPILQFYYKGKIVELTLLLWFQQRDMWAPAPANALKEIPPATISVLQRFSESSGAETTDAVEKIKNVVFR